jgi:uncharacterized membrane protein
MSPATETQDIFEFGGSERRPSRGATAEKWLSLIGGGALLSYGLTRRDWPGAALASAGGYFVYRGATVRAAPQAVRVERAITINRPVQEVFSFWRRLENLPRFMSHLQAVERRDERTSRWIAQAPAGRTVTWDAETTDVRENELIAWRTVPDSDVEHFGQVSFRPAPGNRGTEVKVVLEYRPPLGRAGRLLALLFGEEPEQQIREDLRHLKQILEAGEVPTTKGQPSGRRSLVGRQFQKREEPVRPVVAKPARRIQPLAREERVQQS